MVDLEEIEWHVEAARRYLEEAFKLLGSGDPYDAAEKVWAAVRHATMALTLKFIGLAAPTEGVTWREFVEEAFRRAGLSQEESRMWANYFVEVRRGLHGDVFYGLFYEEKEHRPLIERSREYVELVEKLLHSKTHS